MAKSATRRSFIRCLIEAATKNIETGIWVAGRYFVADTFHHRDVLLSDEVLEYLLAKRIITKAQHKKFLKTRLTYEGVDELESILNSYGYFFVEQIYRGTIYIKAMDFRRSTFRNIQYGLLEMGVAGLDKILIDGDGVSMGGADPDAKVFDFEMFMTRNW